MAVSIIIPTRNRSRILLESLNYAVKAINGEDAEIIIVNDGDEKVIIPDAIQPRVQFVPNIKKGVSAARNYGASLAKGDILLFIDDDMHITRESLENIASLKQNHIFDDSCVCLNWIYPDELSIEMNKSKIGRYLLKHRYHTMEGRMHKKIDYSKKLDTDTAIGSCSFAISKDLFKKIGGYDERIIFQGEDIRISKKLNESNIPIKILTRVTAYHNHVDRMDIDGFLDRIYRGYSSQIKAGIPHHFSSLKKIIYPLLLPLFPFIKFLFEKAPNKRFFDRITFRLTGMLASLTYFKAIKDSPS